MKGLDKLISEKDIRNIIRQTLFEEVDTETAFDQGSTMEMIAQQKAAQTAEKRKQIHKAGAAKKSGEKEIEEDGAPDENPKVKLDQLPDISVEQVAKKINQMRAGKSLKDKSAMNNLTSYFQRLNGPERIALYAFLQGLAKVIGGKDGEDVKVPASKPYDIDMERETKTNSRKKHFKKSQTSNTSKTSKGKTTKGSEPDRDSTPIVVGENANKSRELRIIKANRV